MADRKNTIKIHLDKMLIAGIQILLERERSLGIQSSTSKIIKDSVRNYFDTKDITEEQIIAKVSEIDRSEEPSHALDPNDCIAEQLGLGVPEEGIFYINWDFPTVTRIHHSSCYYTQMFSSDKENQPKTKTQGRWEELRDNLREAEEKCVSRFGLENMGTRWDFCKICFKSIK